MVTGIVNLAPESLPTTVNVACKKLFEPNNVFTVVAVILIVVPTTVLETFVPIVTVELRAVASGVLIPTPLNVLNVLKSEMVAV